MSYLLQVAIMQTLVLLAYHVLLDREPLGQLKRMVLLAGLLLPFAIPHWAIYEVLLSPAIYHEATELVVNRVAPANENTAITTSADWLYPLYWLGFSAMLLRFCYALGVHTRQLVAGVGEGWRGGAYWIAVPQLQTVYSFGPWIFYPRGSVPSPAVTLHELTHVRQWHTLDRLLIAALRVVCWFNPILYCYERAIVRNHELIADRRALTLSGSTVESYQHQLLAAVTRQTAPRLGSGISFSFTKHRLLMLRTSPSSPSRLLLKGLFLTSLWTALVFTFAATAYAQTSATDPAPASAPPPPPPPPGLPKLADPTQWAQMDAADRARRELAIHQSRQGRAITQRELNDWQDTATYGVWLDGNRVANDVLATRDPADLHAAHTSKLMPNAVHYGQYTYHLELSTKAAYDARLKALKEKVADLGGGC